MVTGTAGPIIALAAVLSISDLAEQADRVDQSQRRTATRWRGVTPGAVNDLMHKIGARRRQPTGPKPAGVVSLSAWLHRTDRQISLLGIWFVVALVNVCLQASLLAISLVSIADQTNSIPVPMAVTFPVGGIVLLAVSGIALMVQKSALRRAERDAALHLGADPERMPDDPGN